jgi:hypothetical protein
MVKILVFCRNMGIVIWFAHTSLLRQTITCSIVGDKASTKLSSNELKRQLDAPSPEKE